MQLNPEEADGGGGVGLIMGCLERGGQGKTGAEPKHPRLRKSYE